jgi:hypothetical protein
MENNKMKIFAVLAFAFFGMTFFVSCSNDDDPEEPIKSKVLTIKAKVNTPSTRTSYVDDSEGGIISVNWEGEEKITVVSINDQGITAVDEFSSTGTAGRATAEFTGEYNGNVGDKMVCLYPAVSTPAGAARYSGVEVGSSAVTVNFPPHGFNKDANSLKDWDVMIGEVTVSDGTMTVGLNRKICVLKLGVSGSYPYSSGSCRYITHAGIKASDSEGNDILFVQSGQIDMKKSSFSQNIVADSYYPENKTYIASGQQNTEGETSYYIPLLADGTLNAGEKLIIKYTTMERYDFSRPDTYEYSKIHDVTSGKELTFIPGKMYTMHVHL